MAYRCIVYSKNASGSFDSQIVDSAEIPKGWSPDPADFDKPAEEPKAVKGREKAVADGNN
jgi:hypothetical protein